MQRQMGFTLVEIMIVVAIIGILTAVALPAYTEYVKESRRVDAQQYLLQLSGTLERNYTRLGEYPAEDSITPETSDYYAYKGVDEAAVTAELAVQKSIGQRLTEFFGLFKTMPKTMRQLAVVQFFSWFALFIMWVYTMPAITQNPWGIEAKWFDPDYLESYDVIPA